MRNLMLTWCDFNIYTRLISDIMCQDPCRCYGFSLSCHGVGISSLPISNNNTTRMLRSIDLSGNNLILVKDSFQGFHWLAKLRLDNSGISDINGGIFGDLQNLYHLNLSSNMIARIEVGAFVGLSSLRRLDLSENLLDGLSRFTFMELVSLRHLILTHNPMMTVAQDTFHPLSSLNILNTDAYKFCCIADVEVCTPEPDAFSSCTDLMANSALQVQGVILSLWHEAATTPLASEDAAFIESCTAIGWKVWDSVILL